MAAPTGEAFTWVGSGAPILAFVAGFGAKWLAEVIQHKHVTERERAARKEARRDLLMERRYDFQRESLLELQEVCLRLMRCAGRANHLDTMSFRELGVWGKSLLPEDLDNDFRLETARSALMMVRVRDDEVRRLVADLKSNTAGIAMAHSQEESDDALRAAANLIEHLNERIGVVLREMEDGEISSLAEP